MGSERHLDTANGGLSSLGGTRLAVIASNHHLESLKAQRSAEWLGDVEFHAAGIDETLDTQILAASDLVVVEIDPNLEKSAKRIADIRSYKPDLPIVAAVEHADISLVRALVRSGVEDVVAIPLRADELLQTAIAVLEVRERDQVGDVEQAPLVAIMRAMSGCGATTLATHLAAMLADETVSDPTVCVIDLDIQYGRVAQVLDLHPRRDLGDLLAAGNRLDAAFFRSIATPHESGIAVVAAPQDINPIESVPIERLDAILRIARRDYDYVIVDTPSNLTNWGLSLLSSADRVVMLTTPTIESIRQAKRRLDLFRNVGLDPRSISIVLNQVKKRVFSPISKHDVEDALHMKIAAVLHTEPSIIGNAQDQGKLTYELRPKSTYWAELSEFATDLAHQLEDGGGA